MPRRVIQIICLLAKFWLELNVVNGPEATSIVFQSLPTEKSGPVAQFTEERGLSSRKEKSQLWEYTLSRISRVSKCLTLRAGKMRCIERI
jgi:hypothetical protein